MKLYTYYRSSASFRVRIALNLKKLEADYCYVDLSASQHFSKDFIKINAQSLVPVLIDESTVVTQSLAILEYLEEAYPSYPILPQDIATRANIRAFVQAIACEIQPFGNVRPLKYLKEHYTISEEGIEDWKRHWVMLGLSALENNLKHGDQNTAFTFTDYPSMAEICLIPQMLNAERFGVDITQYQRLYKIYQTCLALPEFMSAHPSQQRDNPDVC